jgi:hypothetical protein
MVIFPKKNRSNDLSVKQPFGQMTIFHFFSEMTFRPNDLFGELFFRSNGVRLNGDLVKWCSVKWCFGQKTIGQENSAVK